MKYRKKPVVIEAYQTEKELDIETLEGTMHASVGDYIITGVRGEQYPCKPDIFEQTYEPADAQAASPWHMVEEDPPNGKEDAIFYYEWTGISGTVYRETSIISLNELIALGCRPIEWMEIPERREPPKAVARTEHIILPKSKWMTTNRIEPPKEDADANK